MIDLYAFVPLSAYLSGLVVEYVAYFVVLEEVTINANIRSTRSIDEDGDTAFSWVD